MKFIKAICLVLVLFTLTACGEVKELSEKEISKALEKDGFLLNDFTSQIEDRKMKKAVVANNGVYQMEYYIFTDEAAAKEAYKNNKKAFVDLNKTKGKEKNKDNYDKYTQKLSDTYNSVIRVGKTIIYASIDTRNKKDFNKVLDKLNY